MVDTDCMTEASEESNRNRPYFHHISSEQLAIEKTICNKKKKLHMRVSLSVLGKVTKHGVLRCINKKVVHVFHREGSYRPPQVG